MRRRTVLWSGSMRDLQYNSRAFWRRNIPIGAALLEVSSTVWFEPGDSVLIQSGRDPKYGRVVGIEPTTTLGLALD